MTQLILITGASTGIGRATALELAAKGHTVLAGIRNQDAADELISASGGALEPVFLDIADTGSLDTFCSTYASRFEENGLQGLVNNAGLFGAGPLEYTSMEKWRKMFDVNVFGHVDLTQRLLPYVRKARGRIVFTSSASTRLALPLGGSYCGAKFAIEGIADSLRRELHSFGVKVSIVEPGAIETPMLNATKETYERLADELQGDGADTYRNVASGIAKAVAKFASQSTPPERIAKAILHALFSSNPKVRYFVGTDAKILSTLAAITTDKVMDAILRKMFNQ